jgi:hypothetical protein
MLSRKSIATIIAIILTASIIDIEAGLPDGLLFAAALLTGRMSLSLYREMNNPR